MRTTEEIIEQKAQERADRKLQYIIDRYGDANGERRKPYYREQLIQEAKAMPRRHRPKRPRHETCS